MTKYFLAGILFATTASATINVELVKPADLNDVVSVGLSAADFSGKCVISTSQNEKGDLSYKVTQILEDAGTAQSEFVIAADAKNLMKKSNESGVVEYIAPGRAAIDFRAVFVKSGELAALTVSELTCVNTLVK